MKWVCTVCDYVHEGDEPPEVCPVCSASADMFASDADEPAAAQLEPTQRWVCTVCGYVHEGPEPPEACPVCDAGADLFELLAEAPAAPAAKPSEEGEYLAEWARKADDFERDFAGIQALAATGKSPSSPMRTQRGFPNWDDVLFRGAQLARMPLNSDEPVNTATVIGKSADAPLKLSVPFYVSHMSFGALSKEAKIALARGASEVGTAMCSGEGGLLPEEREAASCYIYELGTAAFSHKDEALRQAEAVEIKIGQAAKPGMGGHVPGTKVTEEIARVRGIKAGEDSISPGRYTGLNKPEDLAAEVARVRDVIGGRPVGIKITASHIEDDIEIVLAADPDFVTIDCRGGGTGSAPDFIKDNVCFPPVYAVHRARKALDEADSDVTLCVTGGFRTSADIAKALAMGADAVALATASLIAIGCQQYRVCNKGTCPVGITTQDPELRARFDIDKSSRRLVNFYTALRRELELIARTNGRSDVHDLDLSDLITLNSEISDYTNIPHA